MERSPSVAPSEPRGRERERRDPDRLAEREPGDDPDEQPCTIALDRCITEHDARIREREHRHHAERDPRMQGMDQTLDGRDGLAPRTRDLVEAREDVAVIRLGQLIEMRLRRGREARDAEPRTRRREQPEHHPSDRRVNTRSE